MLVISNGGFKSGSTWLFNIIESMAPFSKIPDKYLNKGWVNPSIHPDKLEDFFYDVDFKEKNYVSKNHVSDKVKREFILAHEDVFVLNIKRDLRDVIVSAYYHHRRLKDIEIDFSQYYWEKGRFFANKVRSHNLLWKLTSTKVYVSSYEALKNDFHSELRKISEFLGITLSDLKITAIKEQTSLKNLRNKYSEGETVGERATPCNVSSKEIKFFRKGVIGDWQFYFDEKMLNDLANIEKNGLRKKYFLSFFSNKCAF